MPGPNFSSRTVLACTAVLAVLAPCAPARAETVLYSFVGGGDGAVPDSKLAVDNAGNLYGTTQYGGASCKYKEGCGTVFELLPDGTETVLYAFRNFSDGRFPLAVVADQRGNLYGTTTNGGGKYCDCGTVFEVTQSGKYKLIYGFQGGDDGDGPSGLRVDQQGNLYGTTEVGGGSACDCGTVFEVTPKGLHSVLYAFGGYKDGALPFYALIADAKGNLYGTTWEGGYPHCPGFDRIGCGTVYRLRTDGAEAVLYAFRGGSDGSFPSGKLIFDADGNLYGTTSYGGGTDCGGYGCGTVFKIAADGTETILSDFNASGGPAQPGGASSSTAKAICLVRAVGAQRDAGPSIRWRPAARPKRSIPSPAARTAPIRHRDSAKTAATSFSARRTEEEKATGPFLP